MRHSKTTAFSKKLNHQSGYGLSMQLEHLKKIFPKFYDCIDTERVLADAHSAILHDGANVADFEAAERGGRGEFYTAAQRNPLIRSVGIKRLFTLASPGQDLKNLFTEYKILDALGGDGTLTRALSQLLPAAAVPSILTSDISEYMIMEAQKQGLAAIRQPVQSLVLKDNSMDAVLIAYGSHHIPLNQRQLACQEAFRVLRPGGTFIFHDFENNSPVASWFSEVVHPYSLTGHDFPHYTFEEMRYYLRSAGFSAIRTEYLYDPFILSGGSSQEVEYLLGKYLVNMYGLVKLVEKYPDQDECITAYTLAKRHFRYSKQPLMTDTASAVWHIHLSSRDGYWQIEMPRIALVGVAIKPD